MLYIPLALHKHKRPKRDLCWNWKHNSSTWKGIEFECNGINTVAGSTTSSSTRAPQKSMPPLCVLRGRVELEGKSFTSHSFSNQSSVYLEPCYFLRRGSLGVHIFSSYHFHTTREERQFVRFPQTFPPVAEGWITLGLCVLEAPKYSQRWRIWWCFCPCTRPARLPDPPRHVTPRPSLRSSPWWRPPWLHAPRWTPRC